VLTDISANPWPWIAIRTEIVQLLPNLLENALRFSEGGSVACTCSSQPASAHATIGACPHLAAEGKWDSR